MPSKLPSATTAPRASAALPYSGEQPHSPVSSPSIPRCSFAGGTGDLFCPILLPCPPAKAGGSRAADAAVALGSAFAGMTAEGMARQPTRRPGGSPGGAHQQLASPSMTWSADMADGGDGNSGALLVDGGDRHARLTVSPMRTGV